MSIGLIGILVSLAAGVTSMARIAFLLTRRVPVLAHVMRHDYDAALRRFEDGWAWSDGLIDPVGGTPFRNVWARVTYQYGGTEYRNDVQVTSPKEATPTGSSGYGSILSIPTASLPTAQPIGSLG
jgi:hypothetical protein